MQEKEISFVPGLYKIFDEILVNAADNKQRDPSMKCIKVNIDRSTNEISVWNDGKGIPVTIHKEHGIYVPELIFGHLLTSSNYDDAQKKVTGGRNGYGAKLTNIFSKRFVVETADKASGLRFKQVFMNNMSERTKPIVTKCSENWTKITFLPDLEKFGMESLDEDIIDLMVKRVYDLAGCTHKSVKVYLNDEKLPFDSFKEYIKLYLPESSEVPFIYEKVHDRWEICVSVSDGHFQQVSFVNGISTWKGGSHVKYVTEKLTKSILDNILKKHKTSKLKSQHVRNHLWVFVNSLIENPAFDSQTKENLTSRSQTFGSSFDLSDKFVNDVLKSGVVENVLSWAKFKENKDLKKNDGKKNTKITGIPKLEDANAAGGKEASKCTLILTEGDSAKALALSGLSVVGRTYYGVFPLKGKLINVRDARHDTIMKNEEIANIKKILGLQQGKVYEDTSSLRYGHLMIMTDQDHDGSHIKGLIINLFHCYWPSLLKLPGFLTQFITPIVKVSKGREVLSFYTMPEYENWKNELIPSELKKWTVKYYKGLGTSTSKEAKEYFSNLSFHKVDFEWNCDNDEGSSIDLAFNKNSADQRKDWLADFIPGTYLEYGQSAGQTVCYSEFIHKDLILFSMADNIRSIPQLMDGLKPGQRKILYCCLKKNVRKEIKIAQLAGIVSQMSAYHHGEMSLCATIINLAQDYVGSNNLNFLLPNGQFGTRHLSGKDAASPRYIFTALSPVTRKVFHLDDDDLLRYLDDDGKLVEPEWYAPILPVVLINGSDGIGTGWSTRIPNFNPEDIVNVIKGLLHGQTIDELDDIHPWYRGYTGSISYCAKKGHYVIEGIIEKDDNNSVRITELPVGKSTQSYKEFLETMISSGIVTNYASYHTDDTVDFVVNLNIEKCNIEQMSNEELIKFFKLSGTLSISNMVLFDPSGKLRKYETIKEIILEFFEHRLDLYEKRKAYLVKELEFEVKRLQNKARFIRCVVDSEIEISRKKKKDIIQDLVRNKFDQFNPKVSPQDNQELDDNTDDHIDDMASGYDYLLSMKLWSLTEEKIMELNEQVKDKENRLSELLLMTGKQMWLNDLDEFLEANHAFEAERLSSLNDAPKVKGNSRKGLKTGLKKKAVKHESDDDDEWQLKPTSSRAPKKTFVNKSKNVASEEKQETSKHTEKASLRVFSDDEEDDVFSKSKSSLNTKTTTSNDILSSLLSNTFQQVRPSKKNEKTVKKDNNSAEISKVGKSALHDFTEMKVTLDSIPSKKKRGVKTGGAFSPKKVQTKITNAFSPAKDILSPVKKKTKNTTSEARPKRSAVTSSKKVLYALTDSDEDAEFPVKSSGNRVASTMNNKGKKKTSMNYDDDSSIDFDDAFSDDDSEF